MPKFRVEAHLLVSLLLVFIAVGFRAGDQGPVGAKIVRTGPSEWMWAFCGTGSTVFSPGDFSVSWLAIGESVPLNFADEPTLTSVPGIGPSRAREIVKNRALYGAFFRMSDLDRVRGFGPKTVNSVAPFLHVGKLSEVYPKEGSAC